MFPWVATGDDWNFCENSYWLKVQIMSLEAAPLQKFWVVRLKTSQLSHEICLMKQISFLDCFHTHTLLFTIKKFQAHMFTLNIKGLSVVISGTFCEIFLNINWCKYFLKPFLASTFVTRIHHFLLGDNPLTHGVHQMVIHT